MDAISAIRSRRAVRVFEDRPVDRSTIAAIIEDAAHAPFTPLSKDGTWLFVVIEGRERVASYGARALAFARENRPQSAGYEWTDRPGFSVFHGAPAAVIIAGREAVRVALEECTRAGQILEIAAHARGLGTCWVGSPMLWLGDPAVRRELDLPEAWRPFAAFAIGHPALSIVATTPVAERPPVRTIWHGSN